MKCFYCSGKKTDVTNSRVVKKGRVTWRRRYCSSCDKTFTTTESAFADNLFVIKRSGRRERFTYEKLFISIFLALNTKRNADNGTNAKQAKKITVQIMEDILGNTSTQQKNIKSSVLIFSTYTHLKKYGKLYADHYLSYSDFRSQVALKEKIMK